jgi:Bacterial regulatory proteins, tetR family
MKRITDKRQALIDAAFELIWTNSYGAVSVDDICRAAGARKGSFYHFFRSKVDLAEILGPFLAVDDPDTFFFMRGFPNLASRDPMKAKFYEGELWKGELEAVLMPMLDKYDVVLVEDADSLIRW